MVDFSDNQEELAEVLPDRPVRPAKVTVVLVIAIIIGVIYLMGSLSSIPGLIMQVAMPGAFQFDPETDDPAVKLQMEIQGRMAQVTRSYMLPLIGSTILCLITGILLLYTSIQALRTGELKYFQRLQTIAFYAISWYSRTRCLSSCCNWRTWLP